MTLTVEKNMVAEELRQKTSQAAKRHKASWIELAQYLHSIYKDKLYKNWGYLAFDTYCKKELSIKETTASKLLKSYSFLEKEEPRLAAANFSESESPKAIPDYESVNVLRLARQNKNIRTEDFADLRQAVLSGGKEAKEVRAQVKKILFDQEAETKEPAEVRRTRRNTSIRRLVSILSNTKKEFESERLLPDYLLKQISDLAAKLEDQLE